MHEAQSSFPSTTHTHTKTKWDLFTCLTLPHLSHHHHLDDELNSLTSVFLGGALVQGFEMLVHIRTTWRQGWPLI
jgi:hypothetical protein